MAVLYANNATTTLSASITNSATSLSVASGKGALFPAITGSDYFYITLTNTAGAMEIAKVTARTTDTFTITRGQDGTTGLAWAAGDKVDLRITKSMLDDLKGERMPAYGPSVGSGGRVMVNMSGNPAWSDANFTYDPIMGQFRATNLRANVGDSAPTWNFNNILHAGNYTSYSPSLTGTGASGTWGISITGSAATVSNISRGNPNVSLNTITTSGFYRINGSEANRPGDWGQLLVVYGGSDTIGQLYFDYTNGAIYSRAGNPSDVGGGGSWSAWRTNLNSANYTSYAPSLTGSGASGTWGISITGNAATATAASTATSATTATTATTANALNTSNSYTGTAFYASDGTNGYFYANRSAIANQAGIQFRTAGITNWYNYLDNSVNTLAWYQTNSNSQVMTLTQAGVLNVTGSITQNGSQVLHAGNYTSYAYPQANTPGSYVTPSGGVNGATNGWSALDGYGTAVPNYGGTDYWVGVWTGGNSSRGIQIAGGYSDAELYFRKGNTAWGTWYRVLNNNNFNNYAPTLTGGSASGTWGISITGNAATATSATTASSTPKVSTSDLRSTALTPGYFGQGLNTVFMANSTDSLSDGGTYHGVVQFQQWSDSSGGGAHQLAFTDNNNIWHRGSSGGLTTWSSWDRLLDSGNYSSYALPLSGGTVTGTARFSVPNNSSYIQIDRTSTSYEAGINFQTAGTTYWWNYTPTGSTSTLNWYANGSIRMQLSNAGILFVNGNTVLHAGNYTSYVSGAQYFGTAATKAIAYNSNTISENITITAGNNGLSAGPVTVSTGFTVTVATGASWSVV
jgi:hypothetical protein